MAQAPIALTGASLQTFFALTSRGATSSVRCGTGSSLGRAGCLSFSKGQVVLPLADGMLGIGKSVNYHTRSRRIRMYARSVLSVPRAGVHATHPPADWSELSTLKFVLKFLAGVPGAAEKERFSKVRPLQLFGVNAFAYLLSVAPAEAAKFVPPPLGTSDALSVTDEVTPADLGGLATVGLILLLVFVVGNVLLPSLMFSNEEPTSPYKRDEEGDFYRDPSFTKKFFSDARASEEDIDEVAWSRAPFSKLAHGFSKILPPPNSASGTPPELAKVKSKALQKPTGPIGSGVKFSGIVAAPGYGSVGPKSQLGDNQAGSTGSNGRSSSV